MERETDNLIRRMIELGLSPKYRAFDYVYYILSNYDTDEIVKMKRNEIIDLICKRFNMTEYAVNSGLSTLIDSCIDKNDAFAKAMPFLRQHDKIYVREYLIVLSTMIDSK